jgi:hypothetical protein
MGYQRAKGEVRSEVVVEHAGADLQEQVRAAG